MVKDLKGLILKLGLILGWIG